MAEMPQRKPIAVPFWQQLTSGLLVPGSLNDRIQVVAPPAFLPEELRPRPGAVALLAHEPSSGDQMVVRPSEDDLGLPRSTLAELIEAARHVPFEIGMAAMSVFQGRLWHIWMDGQAQLALAEEFFGASNPVISRMRHFLRGHARSALLSEQSLFVVQRLLVEHAREGVLGPDLDPDEYESLKRLLLGATSIIDGSHGEFDRPERRVTVEEVITYLTQAGAYYERAAMLETFSRAYSLFFERGPQTEKWESLGVAEWIEEDFPLPLDEQFAAGFALFAASKGMDADQAGRIVVFSLDEFSKTKLASRKGEIAELVSAPRDWYRQRFAEGHGDLRDIAWEVTPFMQRPYLRLADGRLLPLSPRCMISWLGDGFYHRLLSSAQRRTTMRDPMSSKFTSWVGELFESYALDIARSAYPGERPLGGGRVLGEQAYDNGTKRTPDIAIDLGPDLVLIEVRSGYLSRDMRVLGDVRQFKKDIDRVVLKKVRQLGNRISDIARGQATLPGVEIKTVERIWPILVTANITMTEHLYDWFESQRPASYSLARVQPLTILDAEDFEILMGIVESGVALPGILARWHAGPYRRLELKRWVDGAPGVASAERPSFCAETWDRLTATLNAALWPDEAPRRETI